MIPSDHFVRFYNEVFKALEERGHEHLVAYWRELGRLQVLELADRFRTGGLPACREYWARIVQEENCVADLTLTEDYFEFRMRQCPSLGKALDNDAAPCAHYCDHCMAWIEPVMAAAGLQAAYDIESRTEPHCVFRVYKDPAKAHDFEQQARVPAKPYAVKENHCEVRPENRMELTRLMTTAGTAFAMLPPQAAAPAPTLLLFAWGDTVTLTTEPYCRVGRLLYGRGWNVVSLDLPCHGADRRASEPAELDGWAARTATGEDFVAKFLEQVNDVVGYLVKTGVADPVRIAAAGTSRGGFMAFQAAAGNSRIRAVAGFAPVTDLLALREFAGQEQNSLTRRLALMNAAKALAGRAAWITIGNADARVDTSKAEAFANALPGVTLRVLPVPGHNSLTEWHDAAADWLEKVT